jgi:hypothetical protein
MLTLRSKMLPMAQVPRELARDRPRCGHAAQRELHRAFQMCESSP